MNALTTTLIPTFILLFFSASLAANDLSDIRNYLEYSPIFASAGQPSKAQLKQVKNEGFERVVYIAFANSKGAIANEDQIVKDLGMEYAQIPVIWDTPTKADFNAFAAVMQNAPGKKTLLHCQANYRASAFAFLYRVLYEQVSIEEAKADMNTVWKPDGPWKKLIFELLEENGHSPDCAGCDWNTKD